MATSFSFHSASGASDFIGLRTGRSGHPEIVYDDGVARRMVWRVETPCVDTRPLREALASAMRERRVLPALYAELKRRAIGIEEIDPR